VSADERVLSGRLHAEVEELGRVVARAEALAAKAREKSDPDYLDGVCLNLHGFYAGAERIFEEIAREVDSAVPDGPEWHRDLLVQMSAEVPAVRPAVIDPDTRNCLDQYRGFRHVVRNVYAFQLKPSRIRELIDDLRGCYSGLVRNIDEFRAFLESVP